MNQIAPSVIVGFILTLLSTLLCVVWGVLHLNRTDDESAPTESASAPRTTNPR